MEEHCKHPGNPRHRDGENPNYCGCRYDCPLGMYRCYLESAAPDVAFSYVEDVGEYQGDVFAVGSYDGKILVLHSYYGSCSGCGAWGEGGEPTSTEDVLRESELFDTVDEALEFVRKTYAEASWGQPTEKFYDALRAMKGA